MYLQIPLRALPSQELSVVLNNQNCVISVYTRADRLYFDLIKDGENIVNGIVCLNQNKLVPYRCTGFDGQLFFVDSQGMQDPTFEGLGTRFVLLYDDGDNV